MVATHFNSQTMQRCLKVATFGGRKVKSNPQVGAIITHNNRIIGEGWHKEYGGPHAEIEALASVKSQDLQHLPHAHLFVSLEPCNHHGKTPPCVDAILKAKIPEVSIAILDPTPKMSGKSVQMLKAHGVKVNVLAPSGEAKRILRPFYAQHILKRPYVLLKYAISKDGFIGIQEEQIWLSNQLAQLEVHRTRTKMDAILIGTNTAIIDNPRLTTRQVKGANPLRIVLDKHERIPKEANLLSDTNPTLIITCVKQYQSDELRKILYIDEHNFHLPLIMETLVNRGIHSLMVEGGKSILNSFISESLWDECHLYKTAKTLTSGVKAPSIKGKLHSTTQLSDNKLLIINNL